MVIDGFGRSLVLEIQILGKEVIPRQRGSAGFYGRASDRSEAAWLRSQCRAYLLGFSNRLRLGEGTMVPVEEADEDESFGEPGLRSPTSTRSSPCSSRIVGGSGGSRDRCVRANDLWRSLITAADEMRDKAYTKPS
jgi:hypothetical protein